MVGAQWAVVRVGTGRGYGSALGPCVGPRRGTVAQNTLVELQQAATSSIELHQAPAPHSSCPNKGGLRQNTLLRPHGHSHFMPRKPPFLVYRCLLLAYLLDVPYCYVGPIHDLPILCLLNFRTLTLIIRHSTLLFFFLIPVFSILVTDLLFSTPSLAASSQTTLQYSILEFFAV